MYEEIKKVDPAQANEFAFYVAGNAAACYLNVMPAHAIDRTANAVCSLVTTMAADVKRSKKNVC